jgi:ribosome biogenesis protein SSF1/2
MNNFKTIPDDAQEANLQAQRRTENLVAECFRSLFPPVSPESTQLESVKRILLLNREIPADKDSGSFHITLRHYSVSTKQIGLPRAIRRLNAAEKSKAKAKKGKGVPNLGKLLDVSDYMLDQDGGNYTSASESEPDTDAEVEVLARQSKKLHYRAKLEKLRAANGGSLPKTGEDEGTAEKRGLILSELGPRIKYKLIKIEEGLCEGKVIWHDFLAKTQEEETEMDVQWEKKLAAKEARKRVQRDNVERKRREKEAHNGVRVPDGKEQDIDDMDGYSDWEDDDLSNAGAMETETA